MLKDSFIISLLLVIITTVDNIGVVDTVSYVESLLKLSILLTVVGYPITKILQKLKVFEE